MATAEELEVALDYELSSWRVVVEIESDGNPTTHVAGPGLIGRVRTADLYRDARRCYPKSDVKLYRLEPGECWPNWNEPKPEPWVEWLGNPRHYQ